MKRIYSLITGVFPAAACLAQDTTFSDFDPVPEKLWYLETPVWIGGAVVLLLLLIALLRSGGKRSKNEGLVDGKFRVMKLKKRRTNL